MKFPKSTLFVLLLTFFLAAFAVSLAQTSSQSTQRRQAEESCSMNSMDSCCCKGDSCPMKDGTASADAKDGCCCCDGDSCEMKTGDMKNHAARDGCCCCGGDSSELTKTDHSRGDECCCDTKMKHKDAKHKVKDKAA